MIHRINVFFISFSIVISQIFFINTANASSVGGWNLGSAISQGASTVYEGTKTVLVNGKEIVKKGIVKIAPHAKDVAKIIATGGATAIVSVVVEEIIGKAVDWVLDPANNRITYTDPENITGDFYHRDRPNVKYSSVKDACTQIGLSSIYTKYKFSYVGSKTENGYTCYGKEINASGEEIGAVSMYNYVSGEASKDQETKSIPLDVVASRIIDKAENDDPKAMDITRTATDTIVQEAENDNTKARPIVQELEKTAVRPTTDTATGEATQTEVKTDPITGEPVAETKKTDLKLDFPAFCGYAPILCEAAQVILEFPTTISDMWDAVKEWVKAEDPPKTDTAVELIEPEVPAPTTNYFQWNAYCPFSSDATSVTIGGETSLIESNFTSWCDMATELRPFVLIAGGYFSFMIIAGIGARRDD